MLIKVYPGSTEEMLMLTKVLIQVKQQAFPVKGTDKNKDATMMSEPSKTIGNVALRTVLVRMVIVR